MHFRLTAKSNSQRLLNFLILMRMMPRAHNLEMTYSYFTFILTATLFVFLWKNLELSLIQKQFSCQKVFRARYYLSLKHNLEYGSTYRRMLFQHLQTIQKKSIKLIYKSYISSKLYLLAHLSICQRLPCALQICLCLLFASTIPFLGTLGKLSSSHTHPFTAYCLSMIFPFRLNFTFRNPVLINLNSVVSFAIKKVNIHVVFYEKASALK